MLERGMKTDKFFLTSKVGSNPSENLRSPKGFNRKRVKSEHLQPTETAAKRTLKTDATTQATKRH